MMQIDERGQSVQLPLGSEIRGSGLFEKGAGDFGGGGDGVVFAGCQCQQDLKIAPAAYH